MAQSLLLTGHPGIGKTTIIKKVVRALGPRAGGFYTEEIRGPGGRHGFRLVTLDGEQVVFAHKDFRDPRFPRVGRYGVDVAALDRVGVKALQRAMQEGKLIIIDEIGRMELYSTAFQETLLKAILSSHHVIGTIMAKPHPEADAIKLLASVTIWEVNRMTRDEMPVRVLRWISRLK